MGQYMSTKTGPQDSDDINDEYTREILRELKEAACEFGWRELEEDGPKPYQDEAKKRSKSSLEPFVDWSDVNIRNDTDWRDVRVGVSNQPLYETKLFNRTGVNVTHLVRAQRTTKTTCDIKFEHRTLIGGNAGLKVSIPSALSINAGIKLEDQNQMSCGKSVTTEVMWNVESNVTVPQRTKATVLFSVLETTKHCSFTVVTEISGDVRISFRKDKKRIFLVNTTIGSIVKSFKDEFVSNSKYKIDTSMIELSDDERTVKLTTKGTSVVIYSSEQHVDVTTDELD